MYKVCIMLKGDIADCTHALMRNLYMYIGLHSGVCRGCKDCSCPTHTTPPPTHTPPRPVSEHTLNFPEKQDLWGNGQKTSFYALISNIVLETTSCHQFIVLLRWLLLVYYISRLTNIPNMIYPFQNVRSHSNHQFILKTKC